MKATKSFCNVEQLLSNVPNVNSTVGELTTYGQTFTRNLGFYQDSSKAGYTLYNFLSVDENNEKIAVDNTVVSQSIGIVDHIVTYCLGKVGQIYIDELLTECINYGAPLGFTEITLGAVVQHNQGWFPNWIKWRNSTDTVDNENTVWLSIDSLINEYTDYEIVVVPPINNLDDFFTSASSVKNIINAITVTSTIDRIQSYRSGNPETIVRSDSYNWVNPFNSTDKVAVNWPVLIYGPAGNNIDAIKDSLVEYILANSTHTRAEWTVIFPDIFKRTEFLIIPNWKDYAIPNMTTIEGIYSPLKNSASLTQYVKDIVSQYTADHIDAHLMIGSHPYRSLIFGSIGSAENRDSLYELNQVFSDYISVSTSSTDFNRMSQTTQDWVLMISNLIILAETMTAVSTLPQGVMRVTRDNIIYAAKSFNNIQYLVASKLSVYSHYGISSSTPTETPVDSLPNNNV